MENRRKCEELLKESFAYIAVRRKLYDRYMDVLYEQRGVTPGNVISYVQSMKSLRELSVEQLYWFCTGINSLGVEGRRIDISSFFSKEETSKYALTKVISKKDSIYPIVFSNLIRVSDFQWVTVIDSDLLYSMYKNQAILYNPRTQRGLEKVMRRGNVRYKISINQNSVKEIEEALLNETYTPDDLTFNLNRENASLDYVTTDTSIQINSGQVDIIDGYHRYIALTNIKNENPDFKCNFVLNIMEFDEDTACNYIAQRDKRNKIKKQYISSIDQSNQLSRVVKSLNKSGALYGCVGQSGTATIDAAMLSAFLGAYYPKAKKDRIEATKVLKRMQDVFEEVINLYPELLEGINFVQMAIIIYASTKENSLKILEKLKEIEAECPSYKTDTVTKQKVKEIEAIIERRCD